MSMKMNIWLGAITLPSLQARRTGKELYVWRARAGDRKK
jgi:hypothetical protein